MSLCVSNDKDNHERTPLDLASNNTKAFINQYMTISLPLTTLHIQTVKRLLSADWDISTHDSLLLIAK
jgi:hypothetical protein